VLSLLSFSMNCEGLSTLLLTKMMSLLRLLLSWCTARISLRDTPPMRKMTSRRPEARGSLPAVEPALRAQLVPACR
jgi:hypothetical protein